MSSLVSADQAAEYRAALQNVFESFWRPFSLYVSANTAVISTSQTYSRFGQHDQNAAIDGDNPAVTPQVYTLTGCITYGKDQPYKYIMPGDVGDLKLRKSDGEVNIKVDATGNALLSQVKMVNLDGFNFTLTSNARPHGLLGVPTRWSYTLTKTD